MCSHYAKCIQVGRTAFVITFLHCKRLIILIFFTDWINSYVGGIPTRHIIVIFPLILQQTVRLVFLHAICSDSISHQEQQLQPPAEKQHHMFLLKLRRKDWSLEKVQPLWKRGQKDRCHWRLQSDLMTFNPVVQESRAQGSAAQKREREKKNITTNQNITAAITKGVSHRRAQQPSVYECKIKSRV